jgi:thiamine-phosphate pyrophosphorylase
MNLKNFSLQFITHQTPTYDTVASAQVALDGGCRWIQLRKKDASIEVITETAYQLKELCANYNATFIIDDHVSIALKVNTDGVHLGKHDLPITEARCQMGANYIIGGTANTFADIQQLVADGVDYVGLGPFRFTQTKQNLSALLGATGYQEILSQCEANGIHIPIVAIGGITIADIPTLKQIGIQSIALSSTILQAADPIETTGHICRLLEQ